LLIGGLVVLLIAVVAATAAITYGVTRATNSDNGITPSAAPDQPEFSASDHAAAKQHLCEVYDSTTRGIMSQGPIRTDGEPNLPVVVRAMNAVLAIQNALTPAVPSDLAKTVQHYIDAALDVTTGATNHMPTDEFNKLNSTANDASYAIADACGLPH
jgi:hypothetical protein